MTTSQVQLFDRAEDFTAEELRRFFQSTSYEEEIVQKLKDQGTYLLDGPRGSGKTMLMRVAESQLDEAFRSGGERTLAVFVRFPRATALEGSDQSTDPKYHPFRQWVFAKLLKELIEKIQRIGASAACEAHISTADGDAVLGIPVLSKYIDRLETAYSNPQALVLEENAAFLGISASILSGMDRLDAMHQQFVSLLERFHVARIVFLLDEVAQNLTEDHQSDFFSVIKHLRDPKITCKVAVYPYITSYGRDFEIGHDAVSLTIERPIEDDAYMPFFRAIVMQRVEETPLSAAFEQQPQHLDLLIKASFGNPRALLHIITQLPMNASLQPYDVSNAVKNYVDNEHLKYLHNLQDRLRRFRQVIVLAEDLLQQFVDDLKGLNSKPGPRYAYVAVSSQKAVPFRIHKAVDILVYAGLLGRRGSVKISARESAIRYLVNFGVLIKENAVAEASGGKARRVSIADLLKLLSSPDRDKKKAYTRNSNDLLELNRRSEQEDNLACGQCGKSVRTEDRFCPFCGHRLERQPLYAELLAHGIERLDLNASFLHWLTQDGRFHTVGDIIRASDQELDQIRMVGQVRLRIIRYAAEEYIAG